jgi:hypothetical protein
MNEQQEKATEGAPVIPFIHPDAQLSRVGDLQASFVQVRK